MTKLDYAPPRVAWNWRRFLIRSVVLALLVGCVRYLIYPPVAMVYARLRAAPVRRALFQRCMKHTYPADVVIFDEAEDVRPWRGAVPSALGTTRPAVHKLAPTEGYSANWFIDWRGQGPSQASEWIDLNNKNDLWIPNAVRCRSGMRLLQPGRRQLGPRESYGVSLEVFAHGRHCPNGPNRLVEVRFSATEFVVGTDKPFVAVVAGVPSALFRISEHWENPPPLSFILPPTEPLKLFAGQADAADESHFTIAYSTPAGRGTIDGWLQPDDTVRMQVRDGPAK